MRVSFLAIFLVLSMQSMAHAYVDGSYHCVSTNGRHENTFVIKTLTMAQEKLPMLEITKVIHPDPKDTSGKDQVYHMKGIASHHVGPDGYESLGMAAMRIDLKNGIPFCAQASLEK